MNKTFCAKAWVHLHPVADGTVGLCCDARSVKIMGNLSKNSLAEIAISNGMNEVRRKMLAGEKIPECDFCYSKEVSGVRSIRNMINEVYQDKIDDLIENTNDDGSFKTEWKLRHLNLRLTNLCNFSCRSCGPLYSNLIAREQTNTMTVMDATTIRPSLMEEIFSNLQDVETLSCEGGEPVINDDYWKILDGLIAIGNTDVRLFYITNLSKLEHHGKNLIEYLLKFKKHRLLMSIDAFGDRLELLRNGASWSKIYSNLKEVHAAGINSAYQVTITAYNVWHVSDLERFLIEDGLLNNSTFEHYVSPRPDFINVKILPTSVKDAVKEKIIAHQQFLIENNYEHKCAQWDKLIEYMYADDYTSLIPRFIGYNERVDGWRNQKLYDVFPELIPVKNYYEEHLKV
jgi:sulfatase maturation enzyme AslB (radical SAM superfamily)